MNYKIIDNFLLEKHFDYLNNLNLKKLNQKRYIFIIIKFTKMGSPIQNVCQKTA